MDEREIQANKRDKSKDTKPPNKDADRIKIADKKYFLSKHFKVSNAEAQKFIDSTATQFSFNKV